MFASDRFGLTTPDGSMIVSFLLFLVFVGPYLGLAVHNYQALKRSQPL